MQKYRLTILFVIAAIAFTVIAALTTNRLLIAVLFLVLLAFIAVADWSIQRSRRRELALMEARLAEQEQAQQELAQRAVALEAANQKLEAFSYSISHDLRSLLHSIDCFSQTTLEDYADQIDDLGKDYLGRVRAASQRMAQLIDDLDGLLNPEKRPKGEGRKTEDE
jgi:signal transduction histidine kinase